MPSKFFKKAVAESSQSSKIFAHKSADIVVRIHDLLKLQSKSQQELATSLNKSPSEISKWLSPLHNLTLKSLAKLEAALGEDIIKVTPIPAASESPKNAQLFGISPNNTIKSITQWLVIDVQLLDKNTVKDLIIANQIYEQTIINNRKDFSLSILAYIKAFENEIDAKITPHFKAAGLKAKKYNTFKKKKKLLTKLKNVSELSLAGTIPSCNCKLKKALFLKEKIVLSFKENFLSIDFSILKKIKKYQTTASSNTFDKETTDEAIQLIKSFLNDMLSNYQPNSELSAPPTDKLG